MRAGAGCVQRGSDVHQDGSGECGMCVQCGVLRQWGSVRSGGQLRRQQRRLRVACQLHPPGSRPVVVLVPRYGIEGIVYTCKSGERNPFSYDAKRDVLSAPGCVLRTFDKCRVKISVNAERAHRPKLMLEIVEPRMPST